MDTQPSDITLEERARVALGILEDVLGVNDRMLAERVGLTRQAVEQRRRGLTRFRVDDIDRFSRVLAVPPEVFSMSPAQLLRWLADHKAPEVAEVRRR